VNAGALGAAQVPGGLERFLGEHYRAWILDDAGRQFTSRPTSEEVQAQMHGAAPPSLDLDDLSVSIYGASGVPGSEVDVWFSAGPVGPVGPQGASGQCDQGGTTACRLYRVRLNLYARTGTAELVYDLTDLGAGVVQPAVSPKGRVAAMVKVGWNSAGNYADAAGLVTPVGDGTLTWVREPQSKGADRPELPTYWTDKSLLWSANAGTHSGASQAWENLHRTEISRSRMLSGVLLGGPDGSAVGAGATCSVWPSVDCASWGDPAVHLAPAAEAALPAGPWVAVFGDQGIAGGTYYRGYPLVARLPDGADIQEFDLGMDDNNVPILACHHPSWSTDGSRILCTRELSEDSITVPGIAIHALFKYRFDGSRWVRDGYAVAPGDVTTDPALPAFAGLPFSGSATPLLNYKYAHWLVSDRWVVATAFITEGGSYNVLASRVVLFDTTGVQPPWDLTDLIEAHEGATPGTWRATQSGARPAR